MKWVIRRISDGMYAVSPRFYVYRRAYARRFSTKRLAEAYILSSGFERKTHTAEELRAEKETDKF